MPHPLFRRCPIGDDLVDALERAFAACKKAGLLVMVTTSHSAPLRYDAPPGATVASWISSPNIDILSPQLYGPGTEKSPDFSTSGGVAWSQALLAGFLKARRLPRQLA